MIRSQPSNFTSISYLVFLAALLFFIATNSTLYAKPGSVPSTVPELAARIRPCVVTIRVFDYSGKMVRMGSGFFINAQGDIITNAHVLPAHLRAEIKTFDNDIFAVSAVFERDENRDIAKAHTRVGGPTPFLSLSAQLPKVGDKVLVAGSPMGLDQTISEGSVSALRNLPSRGRAIQISAPISPGSSGGPVLDMSGSVIGIAAFQLVQGQNLNFAIPVSQIRSGPAAPPKSLKIQSLPNGGILITQ